MTAANPVLDTQTVQHGAQIISYAPDDALARSYVSFAQGWVAEYNKMAIDPEVQLPAFRLVSTVPEPALATGDMAQEEFLVGHVCSEDPTQTSMVLVKDTAGRYIRLICRPPIGDELERCSAPA